MSRLVRDPKDILIFGWAKGMKHVKGRDDATPSDIRLRDFKEKWPHYVRVRDGEFVGGILGNCVSLNELMNNLEANSFVSTQRNVKRGKGNTNPRHAYRQQPAVELTEEASEWLKSRLAEAFNKHGRLSVSQLNALDWPSLPVRELRHRAVHSVRDINVQWTDYYALIADQDGRRLTGGQQIHVFDHPENSYLQEIERCRQVFQQHSSLRTMPDEERRLVAGCAGGTSGYFGTTRGAGHFVQLLNTRPATIANALDRVPLVGRVSRRQVETYLNSMIGIPGLGLGVATRLLSMKRPDLFLAVNNANRQGIREVFGRAPATTDGYLRLHERVWRLPWFLSPEPDAVDEGRIWHARVALLDALLYQVHS